MAHEIMKNEIFGMVLNGTKAYRTDRCPIYVNAANSIPNTLAVTHTIVTSHLSPNPHKVVRNT